MRIWIYWAVSFDQLPKFLFQFWKSSSHIWYSFSSNNHATVNFAAFGRQLQVLTNLARASPPRTLTRPSETTGLCASWFTICSDWADTASRGYFNCKFGICELISLTSRSHQFISLQQQQLKNRGARCVWDTAEGGWNIGDITRQRSILSGNVVNIRVNISLIFTIHKNPKKILEEATPDLLRENGKYDVE